MNSLVHFLKGLFGARNKPSRSDPYEHLVAKVKPEDFPQDFEVWILLADDLPIKVRHQGASPSGQHRVQWSSSRRDLVVDRVYFSNPLDTVQTKKA